MCMNFCDKNEPGRKSPTGLGFPEPQAEHSFSHTLGALFMLGITWKH